MTDSIYHGTDWSRHNAMLADMGRRYKRDGQMVVEYVIPEYDGMKFTIPCGSKVKRLSPEEQAVAERTVSCLREPSAGLLVFLGLAIPRAANIEWED